MGNNKFVVLALTKISLIKFTILRKCSIGSLIMLMTLALSACSDLNYNTKNKANIIDANTLSNPTLVAYGDGYIGLTSNTVITGPKMSTFQEKPYWFSIALHGNPQPKNIGQANSGGCVHLDSKSLQQLIEKGWIKLGTNVKIID